MDCSVSVGKTEGPRDPDISKLEKEFNIEFESAVMGFTDDKRDERFTFFAFRKSNIDEAREIIVKITNKLIKLVKPPENGTFMVVLLFYCPEYPGFPDYHEGDLASVFYHNGIIYYGCYDSNIGKFPPLCNETFIKAQTIVNTKQTNAKQTWLQNTWHKFFPKHKKNCSISRI